jgi:hypothetical protein
MIIYYEDKGVIKMEFEENKEIKTFDIPYGITDLYFGKNYDKSINKNILPKTLKKIVFGDNFNQEIYPETLPNGIDTIYFGYYFNKKINSHILPEKLKHLTFNGEYKYPLTINTFPNNLTHLSFKYYNIEIAKNVFPETLIYLKLSIDYNYEFTNGTLPKNLIYLELGAQYSYDIKNLPETLETLYIYGNKNIIKNLPNTIKKIIFYKLEIELNNIPLSVKNIVLINYTKNTSIYLKNLHNDCKILNKDNKEFKI